MSVALLQKYLPENSFIFLKEWFSDYFIHIKITRGRHSKLGDYRKLPDQSHQITINHNLPPQLFFFVLTHELAHLIAFEKFGRRILPHGTEWKATFRKMLLESLTVYNDDLKPKIIKFSASPKANFMASPELVKYFDVLELTDELDYVEELSVGNKFLYRKQTFVLQKKIKKKYLCKNLSNGKDYLFQPLARVQKINQHDPSNQ